MPIREWLGQRDACVRDSRSKMSPDGRDWNGFLKEANNQGQGFWLTNSILLRNEESKYEADQG